MKEQKGITLIALVITIIVLLILAGVSIAMLTGNNGLLTKTNDSAIETEKAEIRENVELAISAVYTDMLAGDPTADFNLAGKESEIATEITKTNAFDGNTDKVTEGTGTLTYKKDKNAYTVNLTANNTKIDTISGPTKVE